MLRKILKWTTLVILLLVGTVTVATAFRQHRTFDAPFPGIKASDDSAVVARGRHLVLGAAHCTDCHSPVRNVDSIMKLGQEPQLTGGFRFRFPLGDFYTPNITPDTATGIGRYTDAEVARVLRHGVKVNGEAALPFMPFQHMADEDLKAIISYLRSTKPVRSTVPANQYTVMGRVVNAFLLSPTGPTQRIPGAVAEDSTADYGGYLVNSVANCYGCHTERDATGGFVGKPMAGGNEFPEEGYTTLVAPNLTPDPTTGRMADWTEAMFLQRFRAGRMIRHSPMPWDSYGRMSDKELKAVYAYLKSLPPVKTGEKK